GADNLYGGKDDDLLIGGTTAYDADATALAALLAEWDSSSDYDVRIGHLWNGGGLNGTYKLNASTVFGDGKTDLMTGGNGRDWFLSFDAAGLDLTDLDPIGKNKKE